VTEGGIELMEASGQVAGGVAHGDGKVPWRCPSYRRGEKASRPRPR
jgi:hypothetical protein